MKNDVHLYFILSFVTGLLLLGLTLLAKRESHEKVFRRLTELSFSLILHGFLIALSLEFGVGSLGIVAWLWPLWCLARLMGTVTEEPLLQRWHGAALSVGLIASAGLFFARGSDIFMAPFALALCMVGLGLLSQGQHHLPKEHRPLLTYSFLVTGALFFILALAQPIWAGGVTFLFTDYLICAGLMMTSLVFVIKLEEITAIDEAQHEEKLRTDKLVSNSKYSELGMMAAGIAHEINNPLAVIQARTTQLLRLYKNPERMEELGQGLEQILYTSERINRTIQGVREFVHDDRVGSSEILVKDLIEDVLAFCGQRMKNHGVNLRFYGIDDQTVWGNKIQLEQILLNLLNNAFDAIEFLPDKWIEVSARVSGERLQLFVKDSGTGIPPEIAAHIMEPFYSTKDIGKGTGLGLALARGIAEKHGGELRYLSEMGHTTFLLELPRRPQEDWGLSMTH